jgi:outer membrane protein TolC
MGIVRYVIALSTFALSCTTGCETIADPMSGSPQLARAPMNSTVSTPPILQPPNSLLEGNSPLPYSTTPVPSSDTPLPINLATALQLANARPLDVQIAGSLVAAAAAELTRAKVLWVPNLMIGTDYFNHLGPQQTSAGTILTDNRNSVMAGLGPEIKFSFSDAVYAPLAARQDLRAREASHQTSQNDTALAVTEAYFGVQQARGELAAATISVKYAEDVARKTQSLLTQGITPPSEVNRANTELGRRKQIVSAARERWRLSSAELTRILRLDPSAVIEPAEPPFLPITVIDRTVTLDGLIPIALTNRPELAEHQAIVRATLAHLKQEKMRPLIPSLAINSASTVPSMSLGYGIFGGGINGRYGDFGQRLDLDVQLLWQFEALGFGNRARVQEQRAFYQAATLDLFRTQDRVAAEVAVAFAQARSAAERMNDAEPALKEGIELVKKNVEELGQTRRIGDAIILLLRPQEAVAAVQSFAQACDDFFTAVADYNRAQFRLYRALGYPANCLANAFPAETPKIPGPVDKPAQLPIAPGVPKMENPQPMNEGISVYPKSDVVPSVYQVISPPPPSVKWSTVPVDSMPSVPAAEPANAPAIELPPLPIPVRPPMVVTERQE